jgi:hypothetical protein
MALEVPYMALVYVAFSCGETKHWRTRATTLILVSVLILNICTRLFESALYYGVAYLGSLVVLGAILFLFTTGSPLSSEREGF